MAPNGTSAVGAQPYTEEQLDFCRRLPKVERHAHLNGSVRQSTLQELYEKTSEGTSTSSAASVAIAKGDTRNLSEMFAVFGVVHRVVRGAELLTRVTREVLEDMSADGVVYAELRTTPREHQDVGLDKRAYIEAVLQGIEEHRRLAKDGACIARLILSIDRKDPVTVAEDTVNLAIEYGNRGVVGLDLCGDPALGWGRWRQDWEPAFERGRKQAGLKVTLHAAEMAGMDEEMADMLAWGPDSLGHSPLKEYALAMSTFGLDEAKVTDLARDAFETSFLEKGRDYNEVLARLRAPG
ncbi:hypothetical protein L7F22_042516 [Adiantum nelumboides]|nr:hypothetical protein [Adiantum nelumboides]